MIECQSSPVDPKLGSLQIRTDFIGILQNHKIEFKIKISWFYIFSVETYGALIVKANGKP